MKYCSSCQSSYPLDYTACPKDQTTLELVTDLRPGMILRGKYEIVEKLGAGGMGAVYKARHVAFGELRAIKFVSAHLLADERALARFRAEAVVARRLQHPNAVKVEDLDTTDDGRPFIVMEYVQGKNLRDFFNGEGDLSTKRVLSLARQTCAALAAAHALGIVHRDIKPDNLMIVTGADSKETVKVADFGLAKVREGFELAAEKAFTQTGFMVGTPPYMSPEQASAEEVDGRSDLYSLGIVLYELLTGRLPFRADTPLSMLIHHRVTAPEPPLSLGVAPPLASFLLKALAKAREDRFQTAEQMDEALRLLSLMPLPEFVGQGIREGFDPQWAGSRHASRVTTMLPTPAPRPTLPARPGPPRPPASGSMSPTRKLTSPPATPPRFVTRDVEEAPAESSSAARIFVPLAAVVLIGAWFALNRSEEKPVPSKTEAAAPVTAATTPEGMAPQGSNGSGPAPATTRSDVEIRFEIDRLLGDSSALSTSRIRVEVANGVVTLSGESPNDATARIAVGLAASVSGVRQVFSALQEASVASTEIASQPPPGQATAPAEPERAPAPPPADPTREQVRALMDRARQKIEGRDPEGAQIDLEAALKLDPNSQVVKDALERLKNRPRPPGPGPTRR